ncbi:MAG: Phenylalanine--tRNA ligase beta subunit [bacterium]|nr:Phenylalanine--tRNA ligase beta subunit [bacterium]
MKLPYHWLTSLIHCNGQSPEELARTLTLLGFEAEVGTGLPCTFAGVIAALVEQARPQGAGTLLTLSDGAERYTVYSTAPGIAVGQVVAFAPPGSTVSGEPIASQTFGEITSEGMVCSSQELGLGRESRDLLELPGVAPGTDLATLLFADQPIVMEYPSNRGDVLSLLGISRELAAHFQQPQPGFERAAATTRHLGDHPEALVHPRLTLRIQDLDLCPRYAARILTDVRVDDSPPELLARLAALGLKPINNIVDITNIVLVELGQPLHPFDLERLASPEVIVRRAHPRETFTTLDGVERTCTTNDLLITDTRGPIALAGVMGGKATEVGWETRAVLLESARFDRVAIRRTARRHALRTDASLRFERGIDPALVEEALDRVAWYVDRYQCGQVEPALWSTGHPDPPARQLVADIDRIAPLLGADIPREEVIRLLEALGFRQTAQAAEWEAMSVPSWRADVHLEEDLAEDVARHYGYNKIPLVLPNAPMKTQVRDWRTQFRFQLKHWLAALGYRELMTFPLGNERTGGVPNPLRPGGTPITLANALSLEQSVLCRTLVAGALDALRTNVRNRQQLPRAFEINKVYWEESGVPQEAEELLIVAVREPGPLAAESAFLEVKGTLELLCQHFHIAATCLPDDNTIPPYASGLAAHWQLGDPAHREGEGAPHGILGIVDSALVDAWDLPLVVAVAQIPWEALWRAAEIGRVPRFAPLPRFPGAHRDLALVVPEGMRYGDLAQVLQQHGGPYLTSVSLFDIYRGKQIPAGQKSMAFSFEFQHPEATLTDEDVSRAMDAMIAAAKSACGATLRQ